MDKKLRVMQIPGDYHARMKVIAFQNGLQLRELSGIAIKQFLDRHENDNSFLSEVNEFRAEQWENPTRNDQIDIEDQIKA